MHEQDLRRTSVKVRRNRKLGLLDELIRARQVSRAPGAKRYEQ